MGHLGQNGRGEGSVSLQYDYTWKLGPELYNILDTGVYQYVEITKR